ncbi:MAG: VCBS repeat-containing protein, partial [Pirellulales bacterium]|nr:VCBS repeat-containing protein [Pirellulales bacterium]
MASLLWTGCNGCSGQGTAAPAKPQPVPAKPPSFETDTDVRFVDVTREAGVQFVYDNGRAAGYHVILESLGGGGGLIDYDLDGRLDIFMPGGGYYGPNREVLGLPSVLYRNQGNWKFADVSVPAGVKQPLAYTHGITAGDYNSDGFPDLLVTGYDNIQLFMNQGDGTFQEVHEAAGLVHRAWSTSPSWGDFNSDGHLDLFIPNYVNWSWENNPTCGKNEEGIPEICSPRRFAGLIDNLYYSNGDGTFRDVSAESGIRQQADMDSDKGLGSVAGD